MLEALFTSMVRVKILSELLVNTEREYHIRELSRTVKAYPMQVRKELNSLESLGLVNREKKGNMILYRLDKDSPIADDLKRLFLKTELVGSEILKVLRNENVKYALIFGSFAKGTEGKGSDIDLLIIGSAKEDALGKAVSKAQENTGREINFILWTEKEFEERAKKQIPLLKDISKTDVIMLLGDGDGFKRALKKGSD